METSSPYPAPDLAAHPLVRAVTDRAVVMDVRSDPVYFSEGTADVLSRAAAIGLRPVVVTPPQTRMTFAARYIIEMMEGRWLHAMPDGTVRSPFTGMRWEYATDPVRPERRGEVIGVDPLESPPVMLAGFSVSVHHAASDALVIGGVAEVLAESLADDEPAAWNVHEPALLRWDRSTVTAHARVRMPGIARVFIVGAKGRFQATVSVRRTDTGVEETVSGIAAVPGVVSAADALPALTERARSALRAVADNVRMPLQGTVSATPGWPDLMQRPGRAAPPVPLAMLVGPRAVHLLALDITTAAAAHRVEQAGSGKLPSVVVSFEPRPDGSWDEIAQLVSVAGVDRVRAAAGVAEPREQEDLR
ncbi:DUF6177 family protein [Demequina muriae]|uniref:DUF6177 family protein n=1 Tax=Demequina muriae TaxID=3051664 RepID=A0ABT8GFR5_9MICO|nr:DUF6177 family protein [Demequina sp. EGI L300058]MDN4480265.1 DUF6177 family protein [Demequina sp. EGI L300058]